MKLQFVKYQGTGNDFILIDNRQLSIAPEEQTIKRLCDRHFGIGADGLMLLMDDKKHDFAMKYYNADGKEGSMCGNGGRCIALFAHKLGIIRKKASFSAIDGVHEAEILHTTNANLAQIQLQMNPVYGIKKYEDGLWLDTGSPHFIIYENLAADSDIMVQGKKYRYDSRFAPEGTNVNFVSITGNDSLRVRTYERGVENETLSCGTGVTAAAVASYDTGKIKSNKVKVTTSGGELIVHFKRKEHTFEDILLQGTAEEVFKGEMEIA